MGGQRNKANCVTNRQLLKAGNMIDGQCKERPKLAADEDATRC